MLSWEVEECHEFGPILLQTQRRLGVFGLIYFDEQIERLFRINFGLSLPDVVDRGFGLWLRQLGQAVEHVHRFVLPTPLLAGRGIDLIHGSPKPHRTIPDGQFRCLHSSTLKLEQNLTPALSALAHAILNPQEPFLATGRNANNYKGAELVILSPKSAVDTVR